MSMSIYLFSRNKPNGFSMIFNTPELHNPPYLIHKATRGSFKQKKKAAIPADRQDRRLPDEPIDHHSRHSVIMNVISR
jgi:hypothetical protein